MKVVFASRLFWPHLGGVEKHVEQLSIELIKQGHEVVVVTSCFDKKLKLQQKVNGIKVIRVDFESLQSKKGIWGWVVANKNIFFEADIVHAHDIAWWLTPLKIVHPLFKFYTTFHGHEGLDKPALNAVIHRKIIETFSTGTICIGDFISKWYFARPDLVSYGGSSLPRKLKEKEKNSAVFVGRLDKDGGVLEYLKGLAISQLEIKLSVYGDGTLRKQAEKYCKNKNLNVNFFGFIENVEEKFDQSEMAFVSGYLAIAEAMQRSCQVFAHFSNELKKDYLTMHPQSQNMKIFKTGKELASHLTGKNHSNTKQAQAWANQQTWSKLTKEYLSLWKQLN